MGSGLARPYPVRHKGLFQRISETGAVISEFSPFTPPMAYQFPMRNRIIVGLSSGVLVVEAALKSGAMITAHLAADEGRDVYAVPGPIESFTSKGTHALIKEGAHLVDDPQDLLDVYFPEDVPKGAHAVELSLFETFPVPDRKKQKPFMILSREEMANRWKKSWPIFPGRFLLSACFSCVWKLPAWSVKRGQSIFSSLKRSQMFYG